MKNLFVGKLVEWNSLINGKITRLKGRVTSIHGNRVEVVGATKIKGFMFKEILYSEELITNPSKSTNSEQ